MLIVLKEDGGMEGIQIQLMQDKENVLFVLQFQKPMRRMEKNWTKEGKLQMEKGKAIRKNVTFDALQSNGAPRSENQENKTAEYIWSAREKGESQKPE